MDTSKTINKLDRFAGQSPCATHRGRCRFAIPADANRQVIEVAGHPRKHMVASESERGRNELGKNLKDSDILPQTKFTVFGAAIIEKKVGSGGNTGRVYLPPDWVGKRVKIIRID
jgi:putative transposon-encoded protein